MKIKIISVSKRTPDWVKNAEEDYIKRFNKDIIIKLINITSQARSKNITIEKIKELEAKKILNEINSGITIVLDEHGENWTTKKLSQKIENWQQNHQTINIVIGGPDGLDKKIIDKASCVWSLSKLTLPHFLAKVILIEQLYRAWSILNNHPYHRE